MREACSYAEQPLPLQMSDDYPALDERVQSLIDHDRYSIKDPENDFIARGCWGSVYRAKDALRPEDDIAVKVLTPTEIALRQMVERNLDESKAMFKEFEELRACSRIVPRRGEIDKTGKPFIVMPYYEKTLCDVLDEQIPQSRRGKYEEEQNLKQLQDIATSIYECHTVLKRAHGDMKPDNFAVDKQGTILLNDLGSSTLCSAGMTMSPRDNIGFLYTRAPESFEEGSRPTKRSDIWSFGSLAYKSVTGKYILQDELDNSKDPREYMQQMDKKALQVMIKNKINRNIPRKYRKMLMRSLKVDPEKRYDQSSMLTEEVSRIKDSLDAGKVVDRYLKRYTLPLFGPILAISCISLMAHMHVPQKTEIPDIKVNQERPLYKIDQDSDETTFIREKIKPEPTEAAPYRRHADILIRNASENRYTVHFLNAYVNTAHTFSIFKASPYTDHQFNIFMQTTDGPTRNLMKQRSGGILPIITQNIEYAMSQARTEQGTIDLEDMCTIARVGKEKLERARDSAKSRHFEDYIKATDYRGEPIISEKNQQFIRKWLSYID